MIELFIVIDKISCITDKKVIQLNGFINTSTVINVHTQKTGIARQQDPSIMVGRSTCVRSLNKKYVFVAVGKSFRQ